MEALDELYVATELLEGANQYQCDGCGHLVNAKRVRLMDMSLYITLHQTSTC